MGATDRGKTTILTGWARDMAAEHRVAVVDTDTGQSEIGAPGTVGVAWARADAARLTELTCAAAFFVGALNPAAAALEHIAAAAAAVRWARAHGAQQILVDTPGYVAGPGARRWWCALVQTLAPDRIVAFARDAELDGLTRAVGAVGGLACETRAPEPEVVRKAPVVRATRRLGRFVRALDGARDLVLPLDTVATLGTTLGTGAPVAPHLVRWAADALRMPLVYGETADGGALALWSRADTVRPGWETRSGMVAEALGARSVRVLALGGLRGTFVGLHAGDGRLTAVGRFVDLDPDRRTAVVCAPPPADADGTALVAFGRFRLAADGQPAGELRPGES